ncbi:MAG: xylulokinase [Clostridia bacterium]|nr:xylulokinase [Clostridia bacterium]
MKFYIGADLGTSALKLLLVNENNKIVHTVTKAYDVAYPHPGWSEQRPEDWWQAFVDGVTELTKDFDKENIQSITVAGQMHGLVILDKEDAVIRPAILWNDGRTEAETAYLNDVIGKQKLSVLTANIAFAGFTAPKLLWLKKHEPEHFNAIQKVMLPKDYINYRLTGVHACDYSDASGMLLLDVKNKCWSKEMLTICSLQEWQMPHLFESYEAIGTILPNAAETLGLNKNIVIAAGAGDNAAAAIGTATIGEGKCNISLGTSGTIFIPSKTCTIDKYNALHAFCHADGAYHLMGCILSAASCNKWFCDEVLNTKDYIAEQEKITENMLGMSNIFFLPYLMGERSPINDTDATGLFIGLRPDTTRTDMLLSVLEGVAFAVRDNLEIAIKSGITIKQSTVCGGGAKSKLWLTILSNVLNLELLVPAFEEGPGYGAAILGMVACKDRKLDDFKEIEMKEIIKPDPQLVQKYEEKYGKYKSIYPAVKDLYKTLNTKI